MGFRLKTSKKTQEIFEELSASSNLKPFALCKIAIAFSLKNESSIEGFEEKDSNGLEFQRATITGEFDSTYKAIIQVKLGRSITDDEYCPYYLKHHIDRGAELLHSQYKYSGGSLEKFLKFIIKEMKGCQLDC